MAAKIIAFCNQKGGAGKTTGALNLGGELSRRGYKVGVVDGDEQESLVEIAALAPEDNIYPATVFSLWRTGRKIHQELKKYVELYDFLIVDCPPAASSPITQSVLRVADLAIVAFIPSSIDSFAAPKIRDAIDNARDTNPELQACILLSRVEEGLGLTKAIITVIEEMGLPILKSRLTKRVVYGESPLIGNSIHALKGKKERLDAAINEIQAFTDEILNQYLSKETA